MSEVIGQIDPFDVRTLVIETVLKGELPRTDKREAI